MAHHIRLLQNNNSPTLLNLSNFFIIQEENSQSKCPSQNLNRPSAINILVPFFREQGLFFQCGVGAALKRGFIACFRKREFYFQEICFLLLISKDWAVEMFMAFFWWDLMFLGVMDGLAVMGDWLQSVRDGFRRRFCWLQKARVRSTVQLEAHVLSSTEYYYSYTRHYYHIPHYVTISGAQESHRNGHRNGKVILYLGIECRR